MAYQRQGNVGYVPYEPEVEYVRTLMTELGFLNLRNYNYDKEALLADVVRWAWKSEPMLPKSFEERMKGFEKNAEKFSPDAVINAIIRLVMREWYSSGVLGGSGQIIFKSKKEVEDEDVDGEDDSLEVQGD